MFGMQLVTYIHGSYQCSELNSMVLLWVGDLIAVAWRFCIAIFLRMSCFGVGHIATWYLLYRVCAFRTWWVASGAICLGSVRRSI